MYVWLSCTGADAAEPTPAAEPVAAAAEDDVEPELEPTAEPEVDLVFFFGGSTSLATATSSPTGCVSAGDAAALRPPQPRPLRLLPLSLRSRPPSPRVGGVTVSSTCSYVPIDMIWVLENLDPFKNTETKTPIPNLALP